MPTATASTSVEDAVQPTPRRPGRAVALDSRRAGTRVRRAPQLRQDAGAGRRARVRDHRSARRAWTPRFAPSSAAVRWSSASAPSTTRCPGSDMPAGTTSSPRRRVGTALALAEVADELGPDGGAARHARRGGRRRKGVAAQRRSVRRHRRHGDAASRADRHRRGALAGAVGGRRSATPAASRTPPSRPISGVNAADAVTVAQVAIGLLRQQLAPGQMVHGIVTDGGQATNVIPARTELRYTMRATNSESLRELEARMAGCFRGGRGRHRLRARGRPRPHPPTPNCCPTRGWPRPSGPRWCGSGRTPVPEDVEASMPLGSTDMGNVTQVMPGIHPIVGIEAGRRVHPPAGVRRRGGRAPARDTAVDRGRDHAGAHGGCAGRDTRASGTGCSSISARRAS